MLSNKENVPPVRQLRQTLRPRRSSPSGRWLVTDDWAHARPKCCTSAGTKAAAFIHLTKNLTWNRMITALCTLDACLLRLISHVAHPKAVYGVGEAPSVLLLFQQHLSRTQSQLPDCIQGSVFVCSRFFWSHTVQVAGISLCEVVCFLFFWLFFFRNDPLLFLLFWDGWVRHIYLRGNHKWDDVTLAEALTIWASETWPWRSSIIR